MFTGIIETTGAVVSLRPTAAGARLVVDAAGLSEPPKPGASLALNGVCQTVAGGTFPILEFDVVPETLRRTTIGRLRPGDRVNLEASLRPGDRLDGHFVQGHVDAIATLRNIDAADREWTMTFELDDAEAAAYVIPKGSIAVDGVSLTIADVHGPQFRVAVIPTTLELTNLSKRRAGDAVNIETDVLVRTIVACVRRTDAHGGTAISRQFLREHGFL